MNIADLVYDQVKSLPEELAREVLDFVVYLHEQRERADWRNLMIAQQSVLAAVWIASEDQVWDHV